MDLSNHGRFWISPSEVTPLLAVGRNPTRETDEEADLLLLALANAGVGVWEYDLVTKTVRVSQQSCEQLGLPDHHPAVMPLEEWLNMVEAGDVDQVRQWASSSNSLAMPHEHKFRVRRPDGALRRLRLSACLLPDQEGRLTRLVGFQFDDTGRERADGGIRESDESFRLIQEAALVGTFVIGSDREIFGSQQYFRNLGLPEDSVSMDLDTLMNLTHPDDRERVEREAEIAVSSADGNDIEYRINRADTGELRWIFARLRCERADDGQLLRVIGAHLDITGPKLAEAALHESTALNQSILEASADCVKLVDLDGRLLFMNQRGLEALEIEDGSSLLGTEWAEILPPVERNKVQMAIESARKGQAGHFNAGCPTTTGKPKWWDVVVTPVCDEQGQPKHLLAISRDITEHRDHMAQIR